MKKRITFELLRDWTRDKTGLLLKKEAVGVAEILSFVSLKDGSHLGTVQTLRDAEAWIRGWIAAEDFRKAK